jgi:hypothetical protein
MNYELFKEHTIFQRRNQIKKFFLSIELYGHNQLPEICFFVAKKRHNTRFFTWDKQCNQTNNIQPG